MNIICMAYTGVCGAYIGLCSFCIGVYTVYAHVVWGVICVFNHEWLVQSCIGLHKHLLNYVCVMLFTYHICVGLSRLL